MNRSSHLLGYNNNVRHRGQIFHIQTEDSGVKTPRIHSHLFADGGRIVKSTRTDYSEQLQNPDLKLWVKAKMKEQHKNMFVALRSGELDEVIGFAVEINAPENQRAGASINSTQSQKLAHSTAAENNLVVSSGSATITGSPLVGLEEKESSQLAQEDPVIDRNTVAVSRGEGHREPQQLKVGSEGLLQQVSAQQQAAGASPAMSAKRPAPKFSGVSGNSRGIFGEKSRQEDTLDEAILSYLAEEPKSSK